MRGGNRSRDRAIFFCGARLARMQLIPRFEHEALHAVLAELALFVLLENPEGLGGVLFAHDRRGIENVTELLACEAVEAGVPRIELRPQTRTALGIKAKRRSRVSEILGPGLEV